ncbi:MAG TPA: NarK family nitrate/nitrite MFS transporter [Mycobacteriales bacterium]|nr:NarK family nitrate/nitrite MFS transporter [Mycobacteriales bacterium]
MPPVRPAERLAAFLSWQPRHRVLHATTLAFLLSFVVWFNYAPFQLAIGADLGLTPAQLAVIGLCNIALTVPARLLVGRLLDRFGPRRLYAGLLVAAAVPNTVFATATSFDTLVVARLALGVVGAGFVVGIRMVAEWFDRDEIGTAEGIYGGWGNFGSAVAALVLPSVAVWLADGESAWRWGVFVSGVVAAGYGVAYLLLVRDTPAGTGYERRRTRGPLEVTSPAGVVGLVLLQVPPYAVLGYVAYRLQVAGVLPGATGTLAYATVAALLGRAVVGCVRANRRALAGAYPDRERYPFRSVALLALAYLVSFGTELTVVALLPTYFATTFGLHLAAAGAAGSAFAFTNLVTRPAGGLLSDVRASRARTLAALLVGAAGCFAALSQLSPGWPLVTGIALVALASVFVQAANGAVFAMVPLVQRRQSGSIAGIVGAYGNTGGLLFAAVLFFTATGTSLGDTSLLFAMIAGAALVVGLLCRWLLPEPARAAHPAGPARQPVAVFEAASA